MSTQESQHVYWLCVSNYFHSCTGNHQKTIPSFEITQALDQDIEVNGLTECQSLISFYMLHGGTSGESKSKLLAKASFDCSGVSVL